MVSSDYFRTLRIPLIRGRFLTGQDTQSAPWVVVINQAMARRFWPNDDPIGQVITIKMIKEERPRQIVGIVGDVRQGWLGREPQPEFYAPFQQQPPVYADGWQNRLHRFLVVRTLNAVTALPSRRGFDCLDGAQRDRVARDGFGGDILFDGQPCVCHGCVLVKGKVWRRLKGFQADKGIDITVGLQGISLFLAAIGIYGVISHSIGERTHEIGIRMAIGAARGDVVRLVFRQGLKLTIVGLIIGLAASYALTRIIAVFLYGVKATDPLTLTAATVLLASIACAAILQPARRASRVDPSVALRHQ